MMYGTNNDLLSRSILRAKLAKSEGPPEPEPTAAPVKWPDPGSVQLLPEIQEDAGPRRMTVRSLATHVATIHDLTFDDLCSPVRTNQLIVPRQITMYLAHKKLKVSYPGIGRVLKRDHTTVIHACRSITRKMGDDTDFADKVRDIWEDAEIGHGPQVVAAVHWDVWDRLVEMSKAENQSVDTIAAEAIRAYVELA